VSKSRGLLLLAALAAALVAVPGETACVARPIHVFGGYAYDPTMDCLDPACTIDVIAGVDPGPCAAVRCWQSPGGSLYVTSTACDAPPDYLDQTNNGSSLCVKALAAYGRVGHDMCTAPPAGTGGSGGGCY
jgi:hypothetical protein